MIERIQEWYFQKECKRRGYVFGRLRLDVNGQAIVNVPMMTLHPLVTPIYLNGGAGQVITVMMDLWTDL